MLKAAFAKRFAEQAEYFRRKLALPSEHWDDIRDEQFDRAFIVAGATKADLIADLKAAVQKTMDAGKSIGWFRKEFDAIVRRRGWTGWTGSDSQAGIAWRTRIIYTTNLKTSYSAGRWAQMNDPELLKRNPYLRYVHTTEKNPRLQHKAWHGLVLRADDPWWNAHRPIKAFGCDCKIELLNERGLRRLGKSAPDAAPPEETYEHVVKHSGEIVELPKGVQYGFHYTQGKTAAEAVMAARIDRLDTLDNAVARQHVKALLASPLFTRFFGGQMAGEFPVAVLKESDRLVLGAESNPVLLSRESLAAHLGKHPEIGLEDYRKIQAILDEGAVYRQGEARLVYITLDGVTYRAVLKRTADGRKNYFLTLFRNETGARPRSDSRIR